MKPGHIIESPEITMVFNPSDFLTPDELAARLKVRLSWIPHIKLEGIGSFIGVCVSLA